MPIYHRTVNGRRVWWARVAHKGRTATRICPTTQPAPDVEAALVLEIRRQAARAAERGGLEPATMRQLFELYVAALEARGKSPDTIGRAAQTALAVEAVLPALLAKPVGAVRDADI